MEKINLDDCFEKSEVKGCMCASPEGTLRTNEKMKMVRRQLRSMSALSRMKVHGFRYKDRAQTFPKVSNKTVPFDWRACIY